MIVLTSKQRRELRAQAQALHPVVSVGQHGLTPQVMHEIDVALRAHALVKVRVFSDDREQREQMLAQIAGDLGAAAVQHVGKVLVVWREPGEKAIEAPKKRPVRKTGKERTRAGSKRTTNERKDREPQATARRARGAAAPVVAPRAKFEARRGTSSSPTDPARSPRGKSAPNPRRRRAVKG